MNQFEQYHYDLDCTPIGIYGISVETGYLHGEDGSPIVCAIPDEMDAWRRELGITDPYEWEVSFYGDVISSLSEDGVSHHLSREVAEHFFKCLKQDLRFRPEVLSYTEGDWTTITPAFDPCSDDIEHLKREMDVFILGYFPPAWAEKHGTILGRSKEKDSTPLTYADYKRLNLGTHRLDNLACGRLESVKEWEIVVSVAEGLEDSK